MKALEKDRNRRYDTAAAFAEDLRRHLAFEPVLARPPGGLYRFRRLLKRNKSAFIAGGLVAASLIAGLVASLTLFSQEKEARARAVAAETAQSGLRARAEAGEAKALESAARAEEQVKEASRSDFATAQASFEKGEWQKGLAYLGRSLRYDVTNRNAEDALWLALSCGKRDAGKLPVRQFHAGTNSYARFSPDASSVIVNGTDKVVRLWNVATGEPAGNGLKLEGKLSAEAFSKAGVRIAEMADEKSVRVWDLGTGAQIGHPIVLPENIGIAGLSEDGTRLFTVCDAGDRTNKAQVWDLSSGQSIGPALTSGPAPWPASWYSTAFNADLSRVFMATGPAAFQIYDTRTGMAVGEVMTVVGRESAARSPLRPGGSVNENPDAIYAQFSRDGSRLFTSVLVGADAVTSRVWDAASGKPAGNVFAGVDLSYRMAVSPDGTRLAAVNEKTNAISFIDAEAGSLLNVSLQTPDVPGIFSIRFSQDGTLVLTASESTVRVWNVCTGSPVGLPLNTDASLRSTEFTAEGGGVVTVDSLGSIQIWNAGAGPSGLEWTDQNSTVSPDGTRILINDGTRTLRIRDLLTGKQAGQPLRHGGNVLEAAFADDGTRLLTTCDDLAVRVWDAADGKLVCPPIRHAGAVSRAAFSADGSRVITACTKEPGDLKSLPVETVRALKDSDSTLRLWDVATGQPLGPPVKFQGEAQWSADCSRALLTFVKPAPHRTSNEPVPVECRIVEMISGNPAGTLPLDYAGGLSFSPDGKRLAVINRGKVVVWDASVGQRVELAGLVPDNDAFVSTFNADSTRVLCVGRDRANDVAGIRDTATGQPAGRSFSCSGRIISAAFDADGSRVGIVSDRLVPVSTRVGPFLDPNTKNLSDAGAVIWDHRSGQIIGRIPYDQFGDHALAFSGDGRRVIAKNRRTRTSDPERIFDVRAVERLGDRELAERISVVCGGGRLDRAAGIMVLTGAQERLKEWEALRNDLARAHLTGWERLCSRLVLFLPDSPCSLRTPVTGRDFATRLIPKAWSAGFVAEEYREGYRNHYVTLVSRAQALDPGNPLLPFAFAGLESADGARANSGSQRRAGFLRQYGLSRLPADNILAAEAGKMLVAQNEPELAKKAFSRGLEAPEPAATDLQGLMARALILGGLSRMGEAVPFLEKVFAHSEATESHVLTVLLMALSSDAAVTQIMKSFPADAVLADKAAKVLEQRKKPELARLAFARAAGAPEPADTDIEGLRARTRALLKLDRLSTAAPFCAKLLAHWDATDNDWKLCLNEIVREKDAAGKFLELLPADFRLCMRAAGFFETIKKPELASLAWAKAGSAPLTSDVKQDDFRSVFETLVRLGRMEDAAKVLDKFFAGKEDRAGKISALLANPGGNEAAIKLILQRMPAEMAVTAGRRLRKAPALAQIAFARVLEAPAPDDSDVKGMCARAEALSQLNRLGEALPLIEKIMAHPKVDEEDRINVIRAAAQDAELTKSLIQRLPPDAGLAASAAWILENQNQPDLALLAWARAVEEPLPADKDGAGIYARFQALAKLKRTEEAIPWFEKLMNLPQVEYEAVVDVFKLFRPEETTKMTAILLKSQAVHGLDAPDILLFAQELPEKEIENKRKLFELLMERNPVDSSPDNIAQGFAYDCYLEALAGNQEASAAVYEKGLAKAPKSARLANYRGLALLALGDLKGAAEYFEKALQLQKDRNTYSFHTAIGLIIARWRSGDREDAISACKELIGKESKFASSSYVQEYKVRTGANLPQPDPTPFIEAHEETLRRHPELTPK